MKYTYRKHPSKMSTLMVIYGAGSRAEFKTKYPAGIAHFEEHTVFKGTRNYSAKSWLQKIDSVGGDSNAFTSEDIVGFHATVPEENLETAFECLSEVCCHPTFPADEIEKEKEVVCQEVRMYQDDIDDLAYCTLMGGAFPAGSLGRPIVGTEESVCSITRGDLVDFHNQFFSPEHRLVVLASSQDRVDLVEKYFGIPNNSLVWAPKNPTIYGAPFGLRVEKEGQLQNIIRVAFGGASLDEVLKIHPSKIDVFDSIFGSFGASRLYLRIREEMGLVYRINSSVQDNMDGNLFVIKTATEPENVETVMKEVDNQIDVITNTYPTEDELRCAKNKIRSMVYSSFDTSIGAASNMVDEVFYDAPTTSKYLAEVDSTTTEEVKEIAEKVFNNNKYIVIGCNKE